MSRSRDIASNSLWSAAAAVGRTEQRLEMTLSHALRVAGFPRAWALGLRGVMSPFAAVAVARVFERLSV